MISNDHSVVELPDKDLDVFDQSNPRSLFNIVPPHLQAAMLQIPEQLREMTEHELQKLLDPHVTTSRLRLAFWMEYERSQVTLTKFRISSVYSAVCSKQQFHNKILNDPMKMAWILCPPADYLVAWSDVLNDGINLVKKIINAKNIFDGQGNLINPKAAELALKAIDMATIRVHGAPVIRSQSVNVNVNQNTAQAVGPSPIRSLEEIDKELKRVNMLLGASSGEPIAIPAVKEVVPK